MSATAPMVAVRELTRTFADLVAVERLSFTVGRGELFGLVGPDGAGKTTTLRMLAGVLKPTAGDAVLNGTVTGMTVSPIGFTEQQLASRYLFTMTMRVSFNDLRTNAVLWSNDALVFRGEYELATRGNQALQGDSFLDQERSSFDRIATDVARSIVTSILEAF